MDDFISKPISIQRIEEALDRQASPGAAALPGAVPASAGGEVSPPNSVARPPLDLDLLLARCLNKPVIAARVLGAFHGSAADLAAKLERALLAGDLEQAGRHAHTLKGSAGNVSAETLRAVAAAMEKQCRAGSEAAARAFLPPLQLEVRKALISAEELLRQLDVKAGQRRRQRPARERDGWQGGPGPAGGWPLLTRGIEEKNR
jgi:two-component system sensor histidine kinase/response regulator